MISKISNDAFAKNSRGSVEFKSGPGDMQIAKFIELIVVNCLAC